MGIVSRMHATLADLSQMGVMIRCCMSIALALGEYPDDWDEAAVAPRWARYIPAVRAILAELGMPSEAMVDALVMSMSQAGLRVDARSVMQAQEAIEQVCAAASKDLPDIYEPEA